MLVCDKILNNIHHVKNITLFEQVSIIISPHSEEIAKKFYKEMLSNEKAANFLNHDDVKKRLTASMTNWIQSVFIYRENSEAINEFKKYQFKIGHVHGKIGLPVSFVNFGMYIIKQNISQLLIASDLSREDLGAALTLANQILDCTLQVINESYEGDLVTNEKDSHAFKVQFSTHNLAFDCERLRTSLSDWMRDLLLNIQHESFDSQSLLTIRHSNFGLWVTHKAKLFLSNRPEYISLTELLDKMDETIHQILNSLDNEAKKQKYLQALNTLVNQASWILGDIAKEIINQDNGRDPLTRLFNRRYLDTVMRHETASSLKAGCMFGIAIIDIDFFKKVNDSYGHNNGDRVLVQLAEMLTRDVRAGDFIFRLGGEEFLIVLGGVSSKVIKRVAEKICMTMRNTMFKLADDKLITVTVSIGTALHDGHPDFQRTIRLADEALYQAKHNGRNQVMAALQPSKTSTTINKKQIT
ncbi:MAG: GGDEF domain-containing protein [Mariprofundaceae bacterium]|nr:GGDEF domain-containing protein [Mariprofundaceae bacterium]